MSFDHYIDKDITDNISIKIGRGTLYIYTDLGLDYINKTTNRYSELLKNIGNIGIFVVILTSILSILTFIYGFYASFNIKPTAATDVSNSVLIPGINEFVPISATFIIFITLFISAFVHEFAHAIMGFRENYTVNEWGMILLFGFIPIGAYVDIPSDEIKNGYIWSSIRILSAGILANYILIIVMTLFVIILDISLINGFMYYFGILPNVPSIESITFIESFSFWILFLNINLVIVNSLPIYGIDGGSIYEILYDNYVNIINTKTFVIIISITSLLLVLSLYIIPNI